jgi:hypothetical protein
MRQLDQSLHEVTALLDAGDDLDARAVIRRLARQTADPVLRRELQQLTTNGRSSSWELRKAWERLLWAYNVGR